ncbi:MAG: M48 family metalloprotease [DPANN group archaeon]|nr:M48 family metalloprotease [DPANN group archaeon]
MMLMFETPACLQSCIYATIMSPLFLFSGGVLIIMLLSYYFFQHRLSQKAKLQIKVLSISLTAILIVGVTAYLSNMGHIPGLLNMELFAGAAAYVLSYLLAPVIMGLSLKKQPTSKAIQKFADAESKRLGIMTPKLVAYKDDKPAAFMVSGLKKTMYLSSGLISRLTKAETENVVLHELYHIRHGGFNFKRLFMAIKSFTVIGFLVPVPLEEFDEIEEAKLDKIMLKQGIDMDTVREKLWGKAQ